MYNANLIRSLAGGYTGFGAINVFTSLGNSNYNALQAQINRRFGRRFQMATNYTWSKTIVYSHQRWIPDKLTKDVVNRPHAVNINFGYRLPDLSRFWKHAVARLALDGWNINGVGSTGAQTNANFGAITTAQNQARCSARSLKIRF